MENRNFGEASRNIQYFVNLFFNFFSNFCGSGTDFVDKARGGTGAGVGKSEILERPREIFQYFSNLFFIFSNFCGSGTDFVGKARGGTGAGVGKSEIWRGLEKYSMFF